MMRFATLLLALLHAALTVAVLPPLNFWPLAFLVPVPLGLIAVRTRSLRSIILPVLAAQMLMWLWLLRWIIPVTAAGYPALALYQSIHTLLAVWVLQRACRSPRLARIPMAVLLPLIWTASEYFRGDIAFNGYPWYLLAHPLINWLSFAQSSDLFGAYFVSFLAAIPAGVALDVARVTPGLTKEDPDRDVSTARARSGSSSFVVRPGVVAFLLLIANVAYGQFRLRQQSPLASGPRILAIQTNLPQDNKIGWTPEQQAIDLPAFMQLTREALASVGGPEAVDLIAWPETMVPSLGFEQATRDAVYRFGDNWSYLTRWADAVEALSRDELATPMLVGSGAWVGTSIKIDDDDIAHLEREQEYNSAYLLQGQPPYQRYDKAVLTPFGETMPYISAWPWLEGKLLVLGAGGMQFNLDANPNVQILRLNASSRPFSLAAPICFEDTVSSLCRRMAYADGGKRADIFVNISNDGWFGASKADRILHAQAGRFRCIENRLPMVRCVNTGVSVHVDSCGRLVNAAAGSGYGAINQPAWLLANVMTDSRVTLFGRIGNAFAAVCLLLALGMLMITFIRPARSTPASGAAT